MSKYAQYLHAAGASCDAKLHIILVLSTVIVLWVIPCTVCSSMSVSMAGCTSATAACGVLVGLPSLLQGRTQHLSTYSSCLQQGAPGSCPAAAAVSATVTSSSTNLPAATSCSPSSAVLESHHTRTFKVLLQCYRVVGSCH